MNGNVNRAYAYYKSQHPEAILLFRVGNSYEAYQADADKVRQMLDGVGLKFGLDAQTVCLPSENLSEYLSKLSDDGQAVKLIEYRNDDGEFDVPDVKRLEQEKIDDF